MALELGGEPPDLRVSLQTQVGGATATHSHLAEEEAKD